MLSVLNSRKPPTPSPSKNQPAGTPQSQEKTTGVNKGQNSVKNMPKSGGGNAAANTAESQLVLALQEMYEMSSASST
jgi:hypothetical protein